MHVALINNQEIHYLHTFLQLQINWKFIRSNFVFLFFHISSSFNVNIRADSSNESQYSMQRASCLFYYISRNAIFHCCQMHLYPLIHFGNCLYLKYHLSFPRLSWDKLWTLVPSLAILSMQIAVSQPTRYEGMSRIMFRVPSWIYCSQRKDQRCYLFLNWGYLPWFPFETTLSFLSSCIQIIS